jgi:hypothetical protein
VPFLLKGTLEGSPSIERDSSGWSETEWLYELLIKTLTNIHSKDQGAYSQQFILFVT